MGRGRGTNSGKLNSKQVLFESRNIQGAKSSEVFEPAFIGDPAVPIEKQNPNFNWSKFKNKKEIIRLNVSPIQAKAPKHILATVEEIKMNHPKHFVVCNSCQCMSPFESKEVRDGYLSRKSGCGITACPKDKGDHFGFDFYDLDVLENTIDDNFRSYKTVKELIKYEDMPMLNDLNFEINLKNFYAYNRSSIEQAYRDKVNKSKEERSKSVLYTDHTNFIDKKITFELTYSSFTRNSLGYLEGLNFKENGEDYLIPWYEIEFV